MEGNTRDALLHSVILLKGEIPPEEVGCAHLASKCVAMALEVTRRNGVLPEQATRGRVQ